MWRSNRHGGHLVQVAGRGRLLPCHRPHRSLGHSQHPLPRNGDEGNTRAPAPTNNTDSNTVHAMLTVDDPYHLGQTSFAFALMPVSHIARIARVNRRAGEVWCTETTLDDRIKVVNATVEALRAREMELTMCISRQMGKPLREAREEFAAFDLMAKAMQKMAPRALCELHPMDAPSKRHSATTTASVPARNGARRVVLLEPVGQVLALASWSDPLVTAMSSIVPAVLAGCSVVASTGGLRTPEVARFIEQAFRTGGAPHNLVRALVCSQADVRQALQFHDLADHVVFTGSAREARMVARTLGSLEDRFVCGSFELASKNPAYVAADVADVRKAAISIVHGAFHNAGQSLDTIERVYVHEAVHDSFVEECVQAVRGAWVLGDPLHDERTTMGPIAQLGHVAYLESQVGDALGRGARLVAGTGRGCTDSSNRGRFFSPTVLTRCTNEMRIVREESLGPVLPIVKVRSDVHALECMNDSRFGRTAAVFTSSMEKAGYFAKRLNAGMVCLNRSRVADPYLTLSGRNSSGSGMALGTLSFSQYVRPKSLHLSPKP